MDEESKELVSAVTEAGVRGFLTTIAAPLVEAGDWGADVIRRRRLKTQIKTLVLAKGMLDAAGLPANAIAPRVLVPLLENASLADDPDEANDPADAEAMQARWAALLANAAAGELGADVATGFPAILAQLEPIEARILDELTKLSSPDTIDVWGLRVALGQDAAVEAVRVAFLAHVGNLERLGLCEVRRPNKEMQELVNFLQRERQPDPFVGAPLTTLQPWAIPQPEQRELVILTELGRAFVRACTPPAENIGKA